MRIEKLLFILFNLVLIFVIYRFLLGFHAMDNAQNLQYVIMDLGGDPTDYNECAASLDCYSLHDTYLLGLRMGNQGLWLIIVGAFCSGLLLKGVTDDGSM